MNERENHAWTRSGLAGLLAATLVPCAGPLVAGETIARTFAEGEVAIDLRYRFEGVDQDGFAEDAESSTLRLRLGYETGTYHGVFAGADFEAIVVVGDDGYDSTANGRTEFPVVPDPEGEELNQAYLGYRGIKDTTTFKLGRQRIILDNARFIGNVGWRQNEQTFDAFSIKSAIPGNVSLFAGHLNNANRIFGEDHPDPSRAELNLDADLLNISADFSVGKLTGYAYLIEQEDIPAASHKNFGVRYTGKHELGEKTVLRYTAEYADQSDYADGADTVDADYGLAQIGVTTHGIGVQVGYEILGGDGVYGFQTPLATLHAFNGWTDRFLLTPDTGIRDLNLAVRGAFAGVKLLGVYHDFSADSGGADHGSEYGVSVSRTFNKMWTAALKYASYDSDTFSVDVDKLWITLQFKR